VSGRLHQLENVVAIFHLLLLVDSLSGFILYPVDSLSNGDPQPRAFGNDSKLHVAPQINHQAAGHGHDADPAHPGPSTGESFLVPPAQLTVGLKAQPTPGNLDQQFPHSTVAGSADALFPNAVATVIGCRRQSDRSGQLAAVL